MAMLSPALRSAPTGADAQEPGGWFLQLLDRRPTPCWLVDEQGALVQANALASRMLAARGVALELSDLLLDPDGHVGIAAALQQQDRAVWLAASMRDAGGQILSGRLLIARPGSTPFGPLRVVSFEAEAEAGAAWQRPAAEVAVAPSAQLQTDLAKSAADLAAADIAAAFATLGHEIRTPLNAVLGFAELLRRDIATFSEPQRDRCLGHLQRIADAGTHLLSLSNDLLEPAAVRSSPSASGSQCVSLSSLFYASKALTQDRFTQHQVQLTIEPEGEMLQVLADARRCMQVLCNLLTNAAKYTPAGGQATLSASRVAGWVRIVVADNGPGIDAAGQARLFRAYERLGAEQQQVEGHGLGLFISHQLVTAMNGRIGCRSEPGAGAEFWFELPAA
jgi:signal transduction histidine kinase